MAWGGARPNTGRPKKENNIYVHLRVDRAIADYIKQRAHEESIPLGAVVERCIRKEMEGRQ